MNAPPPTRREVVSETLHGVDVDDPYRWLEDGDDTDVQQWVAEQNRHTREALDARPDRDDWHERLVAFMGLPVALSAEVTITSIEHRAIVLERLAGADQFVLTLRRLDDLDGEPIVLFDPADGVADNAAAIDWFHPSVDGMRIAIGVSEGGTENSVLRVLDVEATLAHKTSTFLGEEIPNTRACSLAWEPDGSGFLYTRYPEGDEYNRTVHSHRLGSAWADDPVVWAEHTTQETWPSVGLSPDGQWVLVHAMVGWGHVDVFLKNRGAGESGVWRTVVQGREATSHFVFDRAGIGLVGMTTADAPNGRIVGVPFESPQDWTTVIGERDAVVGAPTVSGDQLLLTVTADAVDRLERWTHEGEFVEEIELGLSTVASLSADRDGGRAVAVVSGYESPTRLVDVTAYAKPDESEVAKDLVSSVGSGDRPAKPKRDAASSIPKLTVSRQSFESADGTTIGMFLIHRADLTPSPTTPTILNGYGGFAIPMTPAWSPTIAAWCEQGGLYAVAGLRGGIEHGESWHDAGRRSKKQNVFDDFHAAADWLVDAGLTSRAQLAIDGRSNGGLLVGVALTQRPDLCAAVSCGVPLLDMVRYPQFLIARLWTDEYGDPDVAEEFEWLYAYSPYHHVSTGTAYPATYLWTAEGDSRVDPLHARKMAAALQAATSAGHERPILLQQEGRAGHGVGKPVSKRADEQADVLAFFSWQLAEVL